MKLFSTITTTLSLLVTVLLIGTSCKKTFDAPPAYIDPNLTANTTIATLKAVHVSGQYETITDDIIISGIIVADDKSGNFYKEIYIQDETGGIAVEVDGTNLYAQLPIGRRIWVKAKGLSLDDYSGMIQLGVKTYSSGVPTLNGIPSNLIDTYIGKGTLNNVVVPRLVTPADLNDALLGTLVRLEGMEFSKDDLTNTYADTSTYKASEDHYIHSCSGASIDVRSSGYADFAGTPLPSGNGSIIAIYTKYASSFSTTKQLVIRDTTDVQFTGERCYFFEETFGGIGTNGAPLGPLPGWYNIPEVGTKLYQNAVFGTTTVSKEAKISAFATGAAAITSWLITPPIALPTGTPALKLYFTLAAGQASVGIPTFRVYISTTYAGGNTPSTSFTTQLTSAMGAIVPLPPAYPLTSFGPAVTSTVDLSAYAGQTVYIGFRYDGADPATGTKKTATYEVDNVRLSSH